MKRLFLTCLLTLGVAISARSATYPGTLINGGVIPDNDPNGLVDVVNVSGAGLYMTAITVTLNISGGWNGDLYGYLVNPNGGYAILLNRVGRSVTDSYGYSNPGFSITLNDAGSFADVHVSQGTRGQALSGTFSTDGRDVDPDVVLDTTPQTTSMNSFLGGNPNGDWTLYFSDLSPLYQSTITGWSLDITAVPEPVTVALGIFGALFGIVTGGRYLRRKTASK